MSAIRINSLPPDVAPNASDVLPIDGTSVRKATLTDAVNAGRPFASQAEAEAGTSPTKAMSPLLTAQAIAALGGPVFAPVAAGVPTGGTVDQVLGKTGSGDYDMSWRNAGAGDLISTNNLNDVADAPTALGNLGGLSAALAASTYLTQATAASTYQPIGSYQPLDTDLTSWAGVTRAAGFDTFASGPSSANLKALLTDETGSGAAVFAASPTLVTPALGTPSALVLTNATGLPLAGGGTGATDAVGALANFGIFVRTAFSFGIVAGASAAANDTGAAAALTWLNGADNRAIRFDQPGNFNFTTTPFPGIVGSNKAILFAAPSATQIIQTSASTTGAFFKIGDGSTLTTRVFVDDCVLIHQATSGLTDPAVVINEATDIVTKCGAAYAQGVAGYVKTLGNTSRYQGYGLNGSFAAVHNVPFIEISPAAGKTQSEFRFYPFVCLDGTATATTAAMVKITPTGGGLFDSLWMNGCEMWAFGGMPYGVFIDVPVTATNTAGAVNMWFTDCCTDKASTAGVFIRTSGTNTGVTRILNIRFTNFRCDSINGAKNVIILNSATDAAARIQDVTFTAPIFDYQVDKTFDCQNTGTGIMDGIKVIGAQFHEYGSASKSAVMYFACNNWVVEGCSFDSIYGLSGGTVSYALQTSASAANFRFINNDIGTPVRAVDYSQWSTIDDSRIISGNTGSSEPWAAGVKRVASLNASAGNSSTALTSVLSASLPVLIFQQGRRFKYEAWGTFAANANTKALNLVFGASSLTVFSVTTSGGTWHVKGKLMITTTANTERIVGDATFSGGTPVSTSTSFSESLAAAVLTGISVQGGATNDLIVQSAQISLD